MVDWSRPGQAFYELAKEFGQLAGYKQNGWPVIKRNDHPQQWREWYAYYGFRRLLASQQLMREKDEKTVPTLSPYDFDLEFNPQPHQLGPVPRGERDGQWAPPSPEAKERVARLMAGFSGRSIEPAAPDRYRKSA